MTYELTTEILNYNFRVLCLAIMSNSMTVETALNMAGIKLYKKAKSNEEKQIRNKIVLNLHKKGYSRRKIGDALGISPSLAYYIIRTHKELEKGCDPTDAEYGVQHIVSQSSMLKLLNNEAESNAFKGRLQVIDDCCYTITTKQMRCPNSGIVALEDGRYRYLTEKECWRLQGFDDVDYYAALKANPGKTNKLNGALYKQAGNSIPVNILQEIFRVLLNP